MNLVQIRYFAEGKGICGDDFKNKDKYITINLNFLLSLSGIERFTLPFSGSFVDNYAIVTMSNGNMYYIRSHQYDKIQDAIKHQH